MNALHSMHDTIVSLGDLPEVIARIQDKLADNTVRLHYLLYGKDRKSGYEGPFYNGLENDDWLAITQLVIGWIIETLYCTKEVKYNKNIRKLFYEYSLTHTGIKIVTALLANKTFHLPDEEAGKLVALLQDQKTITFINSQVEDVVEEISRKAGYFGRTTKVKQIIDKLGHFCTVMNSMRTLQAVDRKPAVLEAPVTKEIIQEIEENDTLE